MRFHALATDYDGTLAHHGTVNDSTLDALRRLKESGRKLILVSGRQLPELQQVFPAHEIFDVIVAENGALMWVSQTKAETLLAAPPLPQLAEELRRRGAIPLAEGRVILATWQPQETKVFETIRDLGLEMQVIFNKGAVMILPSGVNKASGLRAALESLGLSPHNVVSVGDAENDHALLEMSEAGVAVHNSLSSLKERADWVTLGDHGNGVVELINRLLQDDLVPLSGRLKRHDLQIGRSEDNSPICISPYGLGILIAGPSGAGKSTLAASIIDQLVEQQYQYCLIDPEGDYAEMEKAIILGNSKHAPSVDEILTVLRQPKQSCVVNMIGVNLGDRPGYFEKLLSSLSHMRSETGRPHWLILDEAHHILPASREESIGIRPKHIAGMLFITLEPVHLARSILEGIDLVFAIGPEPKKTIECFAHAIEEIPPQVTEISLTKGQAMGWWRSPRGEPFVFRSVPPALPRHRHVRKYAEGDVKDGAFIFRGSEGRLKLRAQNLFVFLDIGEGIDESTWDYHLRQGDYERWFREVIKDPELADYAGGLASDLAQPSEQIRKLIRTKILERYTAPK